MDQITSTAPADMEGIKLVKVIIMGFDFLFFFVQLQDATLFFSPRFRITAWTADIAGTSTAVRAGQCGHFFQDSVSGFLFLLLGQGGSVAALGGDHVARASSAGGSGAAALSVRRSSPTRGVSVTGF